MRTSFVISLVLLVLTIGGGVWTQSRTGQMAERYISAAEELWVLAEKEEWARADMTAEAYLQSWRDVTPWLQILINHEDIDDVSLALERLLAAIAAKDQGSCYEACAELRENAGHIFHRDALTLGNVL